MSELKQQLKAEILETLNLDDMTVDDIKDDQPLFGDGLGLDSIDALELIVLMEKNYGIKLKNANDAKGVFVSIDVMADYIEKNRTK